MNTEHLFDALSASQCISVHSVHTSSLSIRLQTSAVVLHSISLAFRILRGVRGVRNLPELLRPGRERLGWTRASSPQGQDDALSPRRVEPWSDV